MMKGGKCLAYKTTRNMEKFNEVYANEEKSADHIHYIRTLIEKGICSTFSYSL